MLDADISAGSSVNNKLKKAFNICIYGAFSIILLFYICSIFLYSWRNKVPYIAFFVPASVFMYYVSYKLISVLYGYKNYLATLFIFVLSIIIYSLWNFYAKTQPMSDYRVLINGAKSVLNGTFADLSFDKENYYYFYNFQTGFTLYLAFIMKIFGNSLFALKFIEILVMSFTNILLFHIVKKIYSVKEAIISTLIYITLTFNIAGSSIINNQHISMFLIVLMLYFITGKDSFIYTGIAGAVLAFAVIVRPNAQVVLLAYIAFMILLILSDGKKLLKKNITNLLLFVVVYFIVIYSFDITLKTINLIPISAINANTTYFKIVLGISGKGLYGIPTLSTEKTQIYFDLQRLNFDYELYNQECKKYVIDNITNNTKGVIKYIYNKMLIFCGAIDNQIGFSGVNTPGLRLSHFMKYGGYQQYASLVFFGFIASVKKVTYVIKSKSCNNRIDKEALITIVFILYFVAHILIETQARYRFEQYLCLCIMVAPIFKER